MSTTPTYSSSEPGTPPLEHASPMSPESVALSRFPGLGRLDMLFSNSDEENVYSRKTAETGRTLMHSAAKLLPSWNPTPEEDEEERGAGPSHKLSNEPSYAEEAVPHGTYSMSYPITSKWYHDRITLVLFIVAVLVWSAVLWTHVLQGLLAPVLVDGTNWRIRSRSLSKNTPWAVVDDVMGVAGVCTDGNCQWVPVL